jgi:hypothetical protein
MGSSYASATLAIATSTCRVVPGNLLFTAGHLPQPAVGDLVVGKVNKDLTERPLRPADPGPLFCTGTTPACTASVPTLGRPLEVEQVTGSRQPRVRSLQKLTVSRDCSARCIGFSIGVLVGVRGCQTCGTQHLRYAEARAG